MIECIYVIYRFPKYSDLRQELFQKAFTAELMISDFDHGTLWGTCESEQFLRSLGFEDDFIHAYLSNLIVYCQGQVNAYEATFRSLNWNSAFDDYRLHPENAQTARAQLNNEIEAETREFLSPASEYLQ